MGKTGEGVLAFLHLKRKIPPSSKPLTIDDIVGEPVYFFGDYPSDTALDKALALNMPTARSSTVPQISSIVARSGFLPDKHDRLSSSPPSHPPTFTLSSNPCILLNRHSPFCHRRRVRLGSLPCCLVSLMYIYPSMWPTHQDTLGCGTFSKSTNDIPQYLVLLTLRVVDYPNGVSPFVNPRISLLFYDSVGLLASQDDFNNVISHSQKVLLDPSLFYRIEGST